MKNIVSANSPANFKVKLVASWSTLGPHLFLHLPVCGYSVDSCGSSINHHLFHPQHQILPLDADQVCMCTDQRMHLYIIFTMQLP